MPGLVEAVRHNVNRQAPRVRLFETGQCFIPQIDELDQSNGSVWQFMAKVLLCTSVLIDWWISLT